MKTPTSFLSGALMVLLIAACGVAAAPTTAPAPADQTGASIPFRVDHDAPLAPTERLDRDAESFTRLRVEFNGIRGDRVPAYLYLPKDKAAAPRPAVLLQY